MNRFLNTLFSASVALAAVAPLTSCSMMTEDLDDCPAGLYVRFIYDYNTQRADMFKDHVGHVELYIYDEAGNLVKTEKVSNNMPGAPLSHYGFTMHFEPYDLAPGRYRIQAVALQRDWEEALTTPGAKYRKTEPTRHDNLSVTLDCDDNLHPGWNHHDVSDIAPLDTLWHTLKVMSYDPQDGLAVPDMHKTSRPYSIYPLEDQMVEVRKDHATYATVSLIRDTKHLNITLRELDTPADVYGDKYEVKILDNNRHVAHDNEVVTTDSLHYSPYASWTTRFLDDGTMEVEKVHNGNPGQYQAKAASATDNRRTIQRTAHYNVMFNRLMYNESDNAKNATLSITNKETGAVVAHINLPSILSQGRMAYELYNYGHQEYLDREYDYHLDFFLKGDKWIYCDIVINVLSWSKRTQNVEF